jgi:nicotinamidase/pyrazinamidase
MKALILVDIQNDFVPGGTLAVPDGDKVVPICNRLMERFGLVIATQDWHPKTHGSFAVNHPGRRVGEIINLHGLDQILWPVHCVQNTIGAEFVSGLTPCRFSRIFQKGTDPEIDSYSGFYDNGHRRSTGLGEYLREENVTDVFIAGLATDYCVKFTALDARALGFVTWLISDACRGVNLARGDVDAGIEQMRRTGASIITSDQACVIATSS